MKYLALAAMGFLALNMTGVSSATAGHWECMGPAPSCGSSAKKVTKARSAERRSAKQHRAAARHDRSARAERRAAHRAAKQHRATAARTERAPRAARVSSGGGSTGMASYYWQPQRVASGGMFNPNALTAAHKTLPFGTKVRVTNLNNGRTVDVTINDRGPFVRGRIIDLSSRAAGVIGMKGAGVARVSVSVLGR